MSATITWREALRQRTVPASGELVRSLDNEWVQCFACGHACRIPPGRPGICQVRFNEAGTLHVPRGYVAALVSDPIEKKPFFHALPGTTALSFGMLGCDLHCAYCFPGDTLVATDRGDVPFEALFRAGARLHQGSAARIATAGGFRVVTGSGRLRAIRGVFEHPYDAALVTIHASHLPPLRLTPDHRVYATLDPRLAPQPIPAQQLTRGHFLVSPRQYASAAASALDPGGAAVARGEDSVRTEFTPAHVTSSFDLIPIRDLSQEEFRGTVYNLEVDEEHNYLAGSLLVSNCQNWETSQAIRDPQALAPPRPVAAEDIVARALATGASTVASTYNEPLITSEWAVEVFRLAKQRGLRTAFISNGNGTEQVIDYLRPWVDFYKVDLKSFRDRSYRQLGGRLDRILDTIPRLVRLGFWVEIVTLVIPGFNDSKEELTDIARYLAGISPDIPWHVTGFHKDYKMTDPDDTPVSTLERGWEIGRSAGLRFVYAGNRPGRTGDHENSRCFQCQRLLVERLGFHVLRNDLRDGRCPGCDTAIAGIWS